MTQSLRIVVVEDDALIGMYLEELLVGMGHEVSAVTRSESEAVAAEAEHRPDLMIVDGSLGDGNGMAAMNRILAQRFVPHFYITGNPYQVGKQVKDAIVVGKPFNMKELASGIDQAWRSRPLAAGTTP